MTTVEIPAAYKELFLPARYKVFHGGRGSGKSWNFGSAQLIKGMQRPLRFLCAREYQNSIADSVHKLLCDIIHRYGWESFYTITKDRITGRNGTEFMFCGLHHNVQEIKSKEGIDICWVEEAQNVSAESWQVLLPTIRKDGSEIWISFNPQRLDDPTYDFVLHPRPDSIVKKVNYDSNPFFPQALEAERQYMQEVDPEGYRHVWLGECITMTDALIFKGKFEVRAFDTPHDARFYFGADWGFSRDPSVLVRCFILADTLYVDQEAYGVQVDIDDLARRPGEPGRSMFDEVELSRKWPIYADSARPETIAYVAQRGFNIAPAEKWTGSIEDGIAFLRSFRRIVIHERCRHTAHEFESYSYKVDPRTEEILPRIVDKDNHCIAEGSLIYTDRGEIPVEEVTASDRVLTRDGWKRVLWAGVTGESRAVVQIRAGGYSLSCTPDHLIYTITRGFIPAESVTEDDVLLCIANQSSMTAIPGIVTQRHDAGAIASITSARLPKVAKLALHTCIDTFMSRRMVRFRRAFTSITRTGIQTTTRLKIWNVFPPLNMCINTHIPLNGWKSKKFILTALDRSQKHGIKAQKATRNTKKSAVFLTRTLSPNRKRARIAARCFCLMLSAIVTNFARTLANQHGDDNSISMTSRGCAPSAAKPTRLINTVKPSLVRVPVQAVCAQSRPERVFDITVEDQHEFFADGILVHNCIDALRYALSRLIRGGDPVAQMLDAFGGR